MASSVFQNVRAALAALIVARLATDGTTDVTVSEYEPRGEVSREDRVWISRIRIDQEPLAMGGVSRKVAETVSIDLSVWAPRSGADLDDQKLAEQRAELIFASVENAVRADNTVSGTVMFADIESFESVPDYTEAGAEGRITAVITAEANL